MAALVIIIIGGGGWFAGVKKGSPQAATADATTDAPVGSEGDANEAHWDWSRPLPFYVPTCASYVVGYCIGWFFRRLLKVVVLLAALAVALLAVGRFAGWDSKPAQERVKQGSEWTQSEVSAKRDYLLHLLPSAFGGGAGLFLGFRRRSK